MHYHWQLARWALALSVLDTAINDKDSYYAYFLEKCGLDKDVAETRALAMFLAPPTPDTPNGKNAPQYRMPLQPVTSYHAPQHKPSGLQPATETASRKARTHQPHTPLAGIGSVSEVYQSPALQTFTAWLEIGAAQGPSAYFAAVSQAGLMPYPPDSHLERLALSQDTGLLAIQADTSLLAQRATLRASTALFTTVLERSFSQPNADFVETNVIRPMLAGDTRYIAASKGLQQPKDKLAGVAPMSPRIATFCTWLLASMAYVCSQLHTTQADTILQPQAELFEAITDAERQAKARTRKLAHEHHKQADRWHDLVLKDPQIRKLERKAAAQAMGKPTRYRHH